MKPKGEWKRLAVQAAAALLQNANLKGFFKGEIYRGTLKQVCVPGLNCYSCPGAVGACPLGSLQSALGKSKPTFPYYVLGLLLLFGALLGRFVCGFLCPFGLVQDLLYRIPFFKKIRTFPGERYLRPLKYVVAALLVVALPLLYTGVPFFCKYVCPAGTLLGAIPLLSVDQILSDQIGPLFWWKLTVLLVIVLVSLLISRPFCRYLCPLGGFYGLFNRVALVRLKRFESKCVHCDACVPVCAMGIDPKTQFDSTECIRCGRCARVCPTDALSLGLGCFRGKESEGEHKEAGAGAEAKREGKNS